MYHNRVKLKPVVPAYYFITNRVVGQQHLLRDEDKDLLVQLLKNGQLVYGYILLDYCVLDNHYHAAIMIPAASAMSDEEVLARWYRAHPRRLHDTPSAAELHDFRWKIHDVSAVVSNFQQRFTQKLNEKYRRSGHLFGGRFYSTLLQEGRAIANVMAYSALNPVRARIVSDPGAYRWSSYAERVSRGRLQDSDTLLVQLIGGALGFPDHAFELPDTEKLALLWRRFRQRVLTTAAAMLHREHDVRALLELLAVEDLPEEMSLAERLRLPTPIPITTTALGSEEFVAHVSAECSPTAFRSVRPRKPTKTKVWPDLYCLVKPRRWLKLGGGSG